MEIKTKLTKLYYSIGEVAAMFNVSTSLIRYWESEFTFLRPKKNRKGDRQFTEKDIRYLERIYSLVKERGFTLEGAKKELRKKPASKDKATDNARKNSALKSKLTTLQKKMEDLRNSL